MARNLKNIARLIDSAKEKLPPEQDFLADLKRSIEINDRNNKRQPSLTYKPSSMNCIRNMYYQVTGVQTEGDESNYCLVGICNSGSDIHIRIQQAVEDMKNVGIDCEYIDVAKFIEDRGLTDIEVKEKSGMETKLYHKKLNMSFMCDGVIRYKGHYYILELKTETSYKWSMRKDSDPKHHAQATAYSLSLKLPNVLFVYINRDNLDMKAYMYSPTDEDKDNLVAKIIASDECIREGRVPAKPKESENKSFCTYCSYRKRCNLDG